jgi:hypothetical protein
MVDNSVNVTSTSSAAQDRLNGWKEIAAYIGKDERTAQRWEKRGMPVHRVSALDGVVYAWKREIDQWSGAADDCRIGEDAAADSAQPAEPAAAVGSPPPVSSRAIKVTVWTAGVIVAMTLLLVSTKVPASLRGSAVGLALDTRQSVATQGDSFTFSSRSRHEGPLRRWMRTPDGRETMLEPPLFPDVSGQIVWVFSTDCLTQTGRHHVALADEAGVMSNVVSIQVDADARCAAGVPDLVAEAVTVDVQTVHAGADVLSRFVLRNQGVAPAVPSLTRLRLGGSAARTSITDLAVGDVPAPALGAGDTVALEHRFFIPMAVEPGTYYLWVIADNAGANLDTATHNNFARSTALAVLPPSDTRH